MAVSKVEIRDLMKRIVSYGFIGGLAFVSEFVCFISIVSFLGVDRLVIAQSVSFCIGLLVSFFGNRLITFKSKDRDYLNSKNKQLVLYAALAIVNLILSNFILYLLVDYLHAIPEVAKLISMVLVISWNFIIFNKWVFSLK